MRAGGLKYTIDFYSKQNIRDDYSGYEESYSFSFSTKADIKYLGGSQQIVNDQIFPNADIQFTIRYRTDVNEIYRIKFRDVVYEIVNISIIEPKRGMVIRASKMLEM